MISRKVLDKMYEELNSAKAVCKTLQSTTPFNGDTWAGEVHKERIRSALDRVATINLLIDVYLSDQ